MSHVQTCLFLKTAPSVGLKLCYIKYGFHDKHELMGFFGAAGVSSLTKNIFLLFLLMWSTFYVNIIIQNILYNRYIDVDLYKS